MNAAAVSRELAADRAGPGLLGLAERGLLPDSLIRLGIRRLCEQRLRECEQGDPQERKRRHAALMDALAQAPLAIHTEEANAQHYEVPTAFFQQCLGARLKYSSCYFPDATTTLDQAEDAMLQLYAERAGLADGQSILELGCGWGSLTLWMAARYPRARITAVSNSHSQRMHIEAEALRQGLTNIRVITRDINALDLEDDQFDRCVSVEMFEHVRNHQALFKRIARWLRPGGALFVHIFAHRHAAYLFDTEGDDNWMGRHFFTGGMMPAIDTLLWFQHDLRIDGQWLVDGTHYERTANAWLANQDRHRDAIMDVFSRVYPTRALARLWFQRWRIFWMSCAELFGYAGGQEWLVAHYRFIRQS
ncbi:cyclopropane-fatty-acyl-phospholipid synthase family protein [Luteibacter sp. 329MFSha]|uniref:SAM-dependent methyltransferase n=1 Tax=Luteibacter sp. 329MFSha TaxID=1798239 RepID=UPI0008D661EC|nr:cyclopropane-fatty-acyl-phospholipid synthase family protein [Luteibacter sp. 329MFSha]SEV90248.1 cyclopropane-fatty-acyl-phospholipid synthase [Luteibacter sp. 329MFSha]